MSKLTASDLLLTEENRSGAATLLDMARRQYENRPDETAVIFISPTGEHTITVREFFDGAGRYAGTLRGMGVGPRDLVILVMEHSEALLFAFWGAMMIGAVPSIFPFITDKLDAPTYYSRVKQLVTYEGAKAVIASSVYSSGLADLLAETGI